jgi:DnaJ-domain-containing protein 1
LLLAKDKIEERLPGYVVFKWNAFYPDSMSQIFRYDHMLYHGPKNSSTEGYFQFDNLKDSIQVKSVQISSIIPIHRLYPQDLKDNRQFEEYKSTYNCICKYLGLNKPINEEILPHIEIIKSNLDRYAAGERLVNRKWLSVSQFHEWEEQIRKDNEAENNSIKSHLKFRTVKFKGLYHVKLTTVQKHRLYFIVTGLFILACIILYVSTSNKKQPILASPSPKNTHPNFDNKTPSTELIDYYKILGLSKGANINEINKRYRELASHYHPDKVSHLGSKLKILAEQEMKLINEAYQYFKINPPVE